MASYILKKNGLLYNRETGEPKKEVYIRKVPYYTTYTEGKQKCIQSDPWLILKEYNLSEYNIEVEDGINEDEMFMQHIKRSYKKLMRFYSDEKEAKKLLWVREVVRYGKEYLFRK